MDTVEPNELPCADKLAFDTKQQAEAMAVVVEYRHGRQGLRAYQCRFCKLWHLTSSPS